MPDPSPQTPVDPAPAPNSPEARTPDGTLLNQNPSGTPSNPTPEAPAGAPDTYADFTAPDGVTLDKDAIAAIAPVLKELNLTQDQAQKLIEAQAKREGDGAAARKQAYEATRSQWQTETRAEFGTRLDSVVKPTIGQALDLLPEADRTAFRQAMDLTGAGDNPAFIRAFYGLAKLVTEGKQVNAGALPPAAKQGSNPGFAGSMYPANPNQ